MIVKLRGTVERDIQIYDCYREASDDIIIDDYVFASDGTIEDLPEIVNGMIWEVIERS